MGCRKLGIAMVIVLWVIGGAAWADEYTGHLEKKGSLALKFGTQIFPKSDLTDFWDFSPEVTFYPVEIAYEHKLGKALGLELSFCYNQMTDDRDYTSRRSGELDVKNISFSPSLKYNLALNNSMVLFFGLGPDIIQSRGKLTYAILNRTYEDDVSEIAYGGHGLVGLEYYLIKQPAQGNFFDWPLSIGLEYKYTFAEINDYDEELIKKVNAGEGTTHASHKLQVGGHTAAFTIKWHFF